MGRPTGLFSFLAPGGASVARGRRVLVRVGAGAGGRRAAARASARAVPDLHVVAHLAHADAFVRQVLGAMLHPALVDAAGEGGDAVADFHAQVAGIEVVGLGEAFVDVLADAFVGTAVVARADAAVAARALHAIRPVAVHLVVAGAAVVAAEIAAAAMRATAADAVLDILASLVQPVLRGLGPVLAHPQHVLGHGLHVGDGGAGKVVVVWVVAHGVSSSL